MKRVLTLSFLVISCVMVIGAARVHAARPAVEVTRNREYIQRDSGPLAMDIYTPQGEGPFPGVLVVHGGAWTMGSRMQLATIANELAEHGYVAASVSYRLAPAHKFPAQLDDCQAAVRWLRGHAGEFKLDPSRIGGFGYSAGGQLVALLGSLGDEDYREPGVKRDAPSARLQAVVAGGAPCDFRVLAEDSTRLAYWLGGTRAAKADAYRTASPAAFVSSDDPPMFFFHGTRDLLVPAHSPQRMVSLLMNSQVPAEIHLITGAGHFEAMLDQDTMQKALAFADKHLKATRSEGANSSRQAKSTTSPDNVTAADATSRTEDREKTNAN